MKKIIVLLLAISIGLSVCMVRGEAMAYQDNGDMRAERVMARGVWHRPNVTNEETTVEGIRSVLDKLQYAGINLVFLEVFYHGMTVFKTSTVEYYTGFENYDYGEYPDYLSAFVAEAKLRNIEVHAWVEDFYIGVKANRFVRNCPQWLLLNSKGSYRQSEGAASGGYIFLDPANPDVRRFLVDFYDEILTRFPDIKGLNLDYIRYPISSRSDDSGFTLSAMKQFAELQGWQLQDYGIDTFIKKLDASSAHGAFTDFRASCVTGFVESVHEMIKKEHPTALLSTAIFPNAKEAYDLKKQDFKEWIKRGYLDIVTPMVYYDDNNTLRNALQGMMKDCKDEVYCYAGLSSTYHSLPESHVLAQTEICTEVDADGFVFFGSQSVLNKENYIELLKERYGSVRTDDILPHGNIDELIASIAYPTVEALMSKAQNGAEDINRIGELKQMIDDMANSDKSSLAALEELERSLRVLVKYNLQLMVSEDGLPWAREQFELLYRYVSIYAARANIKELLPKESEDIGSGGETYPPEDMPSVPIDPEDPDISDGPADKDGMEEPRMNPIQRFFAWLREIFESLMNLFK